MADFVKCTVVITIPPVELLRTQKRKNWNWSWMRHLQGFLSLPFTNLDMYGEYGLWMPVESNEITGKQQNMKQPVKFKSKYEISV